MFVVYKERFIGPDQINEIILMIRDMAQQEGFVAALAGGVAMQVYGSNRMTNDIDFLLDQEPENIKGLRKIRPIKFGGNSYRAQNGAEVDLIVRNDNYRALYEDALVNLVITPEGISIVTPEHLAAMKLVAARDTDIMDLKWLIKQEGILDLRKIRGIIFRFLGQYGQDRFDDYFEQALVEKEIKRRRETGSTTPD